MTLVRLAAALAAVALVTVFAGCDCASGCAVETAFLVEEVALDVPAELRLGAETPVTARARMRVGGVGTLHLVAGVERLRVLAPVRDTVDFVVGASVATKPVRVAFAAGETVAVPWRIAVDDLPEVSLLTPELRARVTVDSVRLGDGRLVPATPEALCGTVPDACGDVIAGESSSAVRFTLVP